MSTIKVCFYQFFPGGGIGRYTNELARTLSTYPEVEVEVACTPDYFWKDEPAYTAWTELRSISHQVPVIRRFRFLQGQFVNPLRCIEHVVEHEIDVLHFANINHLTFPYWQRHLKGRGIRVAATVHDVRRQKSIINGGWENRQLKAFYRFADALFVHSEYQAHELVEYADVDREKIHHVPHGPYAHGTVHTSREDIRAELGLRQDVQVALFFGQIRDEKNLGGLLRAMRLHQEPLHLVVAGQGDGGRHQGVEYYQKLAHALGIDDRVMFIARYISDEEVGRLFTAADWVALPYLNTFTSQSGVLNVAAHYERPVLVSTAPVLQETTQDCDIGIVSPGDTPAALAEGIERMTRRVRKGHLHAFAQYRDAYSWRENAERTIDVYQSLVAKKRS